MIAQCLACTESQTVDEYCKIYPDTVGCPIKGSTNHHALYKPFLL